VLHTWTRALLYHPHVHYLVTGGGYDGTGWRAAPPRFLVAVRALSVIYRAKFRDALARKHPQIFRTLPREVWRQPWVVHAKPVGSGAPALIYLSRYIFRVAFANANLRYADETSVRFRFRRSEDGAWRTATVTPEEFLRRFLQHVLPRGFQKVRHYGLHHPRRRGALAAARAALANPAPSTPTITESGTPATVSADDPPRCPHCGVLLVLVGTLPRLPRARAPP